MQRPGHEPHAERGVNAEIVYRFALGVDFGNVLCERETVINLRLFDLGENVRFHLKCVRELVREIEQANHGEQFAEPFVVEAEPLDRGGVGVDSVIAAVGDRHRKGEHLLGQDIELARLHDRL